MSKDVPVMTGEWVDKVWEKSKHENVHATDAPFSRYRCPALLGLNITVSQLSKKDRVRFFFNITSVSGNQRCSVLVLFVVFVNFLNIIFQIMCLRKVVIFVAFMNHVDVCL